MIPDLLRSLQKCPQQLQITQLQLHRVTLINYHQRFLSKIGLLEISHDASPLRMVKLRAIHFIKIIIITPDQKCVVVMLIRLWRFVDQIGQMIRELKLPL